MTIGKICVREVDTAVENESIQVAAERMNSRNVGTLVVVNREREPIGILTDRDLTVRAMARGKDPAVTTVQEVMSKSPQTVLADTPIERALEIMRSGPQRRLPVVDRSGKLIGLVSFDDILHLLAEEFHQISELLEYEDPATMGCG